MREKSVFVIFIGVVFICLCRCEEHIASFSPLLGALLVGAPFFARRDSWLVLLFGMLLSDSMYSLIYGYPLFGAWSLFTYSGFAAVLMLGQLRQVSLVGALFVAFAYWAWTNFGSWLISGMYIHSSVGLVECYVAALPFLAHAMLAMTTVFTGKYLFEIFYSLKKSYI